ncbi:MAG: hypothetical protein KatS3mg027_0089 [Bacteroidia bacterium]|nr:MAG: hypothetical protein KatS3mg027_0089 [Bacteroidia bacterium]
MRNFLFKLLLFLIIFAITGLIREYVFQTLNNLIYYKYYKTTSIPIPFGFVWLTRFSYVTLYYLKYPLTIVFVGIFYSLNLFFLKKFQVPSFYIRILTLSYLVLISLSILSMFYAYFFSQKLNDDEYLFSRGLMGIAQSPLIGFVLFVLYLWDKNKLQQHEKRNSNL